MTVFAVLSLFALTAFTKKMTKLDTKLWDLQTRTAADYTLEINLSHNQLEKLNTVVVPEESGLKLAHAMKLKLAIMSDIEKELTAIALERGILEKMVVADINFVYKNGWLMDQLTKRGEAVKAFDVEKIVEANV